MISISHSCIYMVTICIVICIKILLQYGNVYCLWFRCLCMCDLFMCKKNAVCFYKTIFSILTNLGIKKKTVLRQKCQKNVFLLTCCQRQQVEGLAYIQNYCQFRNYCDVFINTNNPTWHSSHNKTCILIFFSNSIT